MNTFNTHACAAKDFESNAASLLQEVKDAGGLIEITESGEESVFMFQANREQLFSLLEDMKILAGIQEGLNDVEAGRTQSFEQVFSDLGRS